MKNKKKIDKYLIYALTVATWLFMFFFIYKRIRFFLDDDMATDMVLAKQLANEGKFILTKNWIGSTELRFLTMQLIFSILFRFFTSWHAVRVIGTIIIDLLFIVLIYFLCRKIKLEKYALLMLLVYALPRSVETFYYTYIGTWYLVYVIYALVILLLFFYYQESHYKIYLLLSFISSLLFSIEGARFILTINLPLLATIIFIIIFKKEKIQNELLYSIVSLLGSIAGYLINKFYILTNYTIPGTMVFHFTNNIKFSYIKEMLLQILKCEGFGETKVASVFSVVVFVLSIVCVFYNIFNSKANRTNLIISLFYFFGILGMTCCFCLTDMVLNTRYYIPIIFLSNLVIISTLVDLKQIKIKKISLVIFVCLNILTSLSIYKNAYQVDKTSELDYIVTELKENEYNSGYGFFWTTNTIMELANGDIKTVCLGFESSTPAEYKNIEEIGMWLQDVGNYTYKPTGKVFLILTNSQKEKFLDLTWFFEEDDLFLKTNNYYVYGFESYQTFREKLKID